VGTARIRPDIGMNGMSAGSSERNSCRRSKFLQVPLPASVWDLFNSPYRSCITTVNIATATTGFGLLKLDKKKLAHFQ
jgi:hypothetical protein